MIKSFFRLFFGVVFILSWTQPLLYAQLTNEILTGAKKDELDTLALENTQKVLEESKGLLERPIDPDKYILGPGDEITIMIASSQPKLHKIKVSPEGTLPIPGVGNVDVKDKSLTESKKLIIGKAKSIYKNLEIEVTLTDLKKFKVIVSGAVFKPNIVASTSADRVSEVIEKAGGMKYTASLRKITLYRVATREYFRVDLLKFSRGLDKEANPFVSGGDQIIVPDMDESSSIGIYGDVPSPGEFEFSPGDSLSDLLRFSLGFFESALLDSVEFTRYQGAAVQSRTIIDLSNWATQFNTSNNLDNNFALIPGDRIFIPRRSEWNKAMKVAIMGEVQYPGYYTISKNKDKVSDVLKRAGGFKETASLQSSILIRQREFKIKDEEMERLYRTPQTEMSENEQRYFQARVREKKGYMAIDFEKIVLDPNVVDNVYLEDEDSLYIPPKKIFVNVQGRVNNPGLIVYQADYNYMDYINLAGGYGFRADEGETMIVKSRGEQFNAESFDYTIEPGDNILVPPEKEVSGWTVLSEGLTIAVQLASIVGLVVSLMALSRN